MGYVIEQFVIMSKPSGRTRCTSTYPNPLVACTGVSHRGKCSLPPEMTLSVHLAIFFLGVPIIGHHEFFGGGSRLRCRGILPGGIKATV